MANVDFGMLVLLGRPNCKHWFLVMQQGSGQLDDFWTRCRDVIFWFLYTITRQSSSGNVYCLPLLAYNLCNVTYIMLCGCCDMGLLHFSLTTLLYIFSGIIQSLGALQPVTLSTCHACFVSPKPLIGNIIRAVCIYFFRFEIVSICSGNKEKKASSTKRLRKRTEPSLVWFDLNVFRSPPYFLNVLALLTLMGFESYRYI
jgi:hypothetical protein